jgi:hypothetical protein
MKPTWCTFHSIYWESKVSTCFEHYLLILRRRCTNFIWYIVSCFCTVAVSLQPCHSQLTLYARNTPNAFCAAPPEDEQVMLETCRGLRFPINWMKSASRWFHYTGITSLKNTKWYLLSTEWQKALLFPCISLSAAGHLTGWFFVLLNGAVPTVQVKMCQLKCKNINESEQTFMLWLYRYDATPCSQPRRWSVPNPEDNNLNCIYIYIHIYIYK